MIVDLELIYVDGSTVITRQRPQPHKIPQGIDVDLRFQVRNSAGTAVDITGWTLTYTLKEDRDDATEIISRGHVATDAVNGKGIFQIQPADTVVTSSPLSPLPGAYVADVRAVRPGGFAEQLLLASDVQLGPMIGEPGTPATTPSVPSGPAIGLRVRTVAKVNVTLTGLQTVNGVSLVDGDRVLLTAQTAAVENGIYVVRAGAWERAADMAAGVRAGGALIVVLSGSNGADTVWLGATDPPADIVGTDPLTFTDVSSTATSVTFAAVQTALAGATGAVDFNNQAITGVSALPFSAVNAAIAAANASIDFNNQTLTNIAGFTFNTAITWTSTATVGPAHTFDGPNIPQGDSLTKFVVPGVNSYAIEIDAVTNNGAGNTGIRYQWNGASSWRLNNAGTRLAQFDIVNASLHMQARDNLSDEGYSHKLTNTGTSQLAANVFLRLVMGENQFNNPDSLVTTRGIVLSDEYGATALEVWAVEKNGQMKWSNPANVQTTVGAAGGASSLPATPSKYLKVIDDTGTVLVIPAYTP